MTLTRKRMRAVQDVRHGDHLCLAFADDAEQQRVVTTYLADGVRGGERVVYFADQCDPDDVVGWLDAVGVDTAAATARGQLRVTTADDGYLATGRFDAAGMVEALRGELRTSLEAGFRGFRVSGEMGWVLRGVPGAEQLAAYETQVEAVFAGHPASAICQYDARRFSPEQMARFDACHPGAVELSPLYADAALRLVPAFGDGHRVLRVVGSVDYRSTEALVEALRVAAGWPGDVRVDMSGLEFIDLGGVRALARAASRLSAGRRLHVVELSPMLCHVVRLVGWDENPALVLYTGEVYA